MARTKEFDPDAVLRRARDLFWERGYEATSMADLVAHLGIGRASLYATFGSKHDLYLRALHCYTATRDPNPVELLGRPGPALPAVRRLVELYVAEATGERRQRGCMIVNAAAERAAAERAADDDSVARFVESSWSALESALTDALIRARAQGELAADEDPRTLARFVLVFLQGLRVTGQGSAEPDRVRAAATPVLALLS